MKKIMAIILAISLIVSCFGTMTALAIISPEDVVTSFNIEDYTWEDIMTMSNSEFRELLVNFEREYDPFGTYGTNPITVVYDEKEDLNTIQPMWSSGTVDMFGNTIEEGSHELITARACGILLNDKGFWGDTENSSIFIALMISLASIMPDRETELMGGILPFEGHFYDPGTEKSYTGSTTNTAKTNAQYFYNQALSAGRNDENFIEYVGCMLHYVQDACEPHHAANVTAAEYFGVHSYFEEYVDANINSFIDSYTTISNLTYTTGANQSIGSIIHSSAVVAKADVWMVLDPLDRTDWEEVGYRTARAAVMNSAVVLYKLSLELDITLTK